MICACDARLKACISSCSNEMSSDIHAYKNAKKCFFKYTFSAQLEERGADLWRQSFNLGDLDRATEGL